MKKLMVFALGVLSNGEITIALSVLQRISKQDVEIQFVVYKKMVKQIEDSGFTAISFEVRSVTENRDRFYRIVKEFSPDLILCADVFTLDYSSTWSGIGFDELKSIGVPVGSFDEYEWEATGFIQDFIGIKPIKTNAELLTQSDFLIRPCPVNRAEILDDNSIINCSLFDTKSLLASYSADIKKKPQWRESMGIKKDSKIVFIVNSSWEYADVSRKREATRIIEWMPQIIYHYLLAIKEHITVIHVGGRKWLFAESESIDYRHYASVDPVEYKRMLHCADLFCSTNLISVTLSRAALCGIPIVLFQNEKHFDYEKLKPVLERMPDWYRQMAREVFKVYPFKVFPWGWNKFLNPVMTDNLYIELFDRVPLLEPKKCVDMLYKNLFDTGHAGEKRGKLNDYLKLIDNLPSPAKILEIV